MLQWCACSTRKDSFILGSTLLRPSTRKCLVSRHSDSSSSQRVQCDAPPTANELAHRLRGGGERQRAQFDGCCVLPERHGGVLRRAGCVRTPSSTTGFHTTQHARHAHRRRATQCAARPNVITSVSGAPSAVRNLQQRHSHAASHASSTQSH
jgi:hypothetical protein